MTGAPLPDDEEHACDIVGADRPGRCLVTCDHATNIVPPWVAGGDLGLPVADMHRHIAMDVGAAGLTRALAEALDAPAILSRFSRLVIDPNRGEDDPTLVMKLYDGTVVPANRCVGAAETEERLARLHRPYHAAYARLAAQRSDTIIVAIHTFTRQLRHRPPRPWQIGILHAPADGRLALPLIARLRAGPDLIVGDNEPYAGHLPGDSIDRHALRTGRPNVLIEVRNDLLASAGVQHAWAARLAPILLGVIAETRA